MPRFRGLTEVIQDQLKEFRKDLTVDVSQASPFSVIQGSNIPFPREQDASRGVLRWGFSTWGIETVTTEDKPQA